MKLVNLCLEDSRTLLSYNVSKVREQASVLRCVCKVAQHMEGVEKMSSCEYSVVNELADGCYHAILLVGDEWTRRTTDLDESFEDHAESWLCLHTGDGDSEGNDLVVAVDSSEDTNSILFASRTNLLDQVVGEIIAHSLTIGAKVALHFRADSNNDVGKLTFRYWERIKAEVVVSPLKLLYELWKRHLCSLDSK